MDFFLLFFFLYSSFSEVYSQKFSSFSSIKNSDIDPAIGSKWLLSRYRAYSETKCQTTCNFNSECLTVFYNRLDGTCSLYSKIFLLNNFIEATNIDFYVKNSESVYILTIIFISFLRPD